MKTKEEKVEPKFKVGDWVVNKFGDVWHIDSFDEKYYQVSNDNKYNYFPISKQDEMRLWTIRDAEVGDVLFSWGLIFMYAGVNPNGLLLYSYIESDRGIPIFEYNIGKPNVGIGSITDTNIHPATKEQRDLLFQKMKEAGYEWNAEKKELKKIEQIL